jgi:WD40 repeat protein
MNPDQIREINIDTGELINEYRWHAQSEFMIRSSFGGASETFVVSGSEDSKIYIWRRNGNAEKLHMLQAHQRGCVNAIAWNPGEPGMFASAGDDASIRM